MLRCLLSCLVAPVVTLALCLAAAQPVCAQTSESAHDSLALTYPDDHKTVLVINSYTHASAWTSALTTPITLALAKIPDIHCQMGYLNCELMTDSIEFQKVVDNFFDKYDDARPDYLVMVGKVAFALRDEIKARWGDIPIMLIATSDKIADLSYYFSGENLNSDNTSKQDLVSLREDFNFSCVIVPPHYQETIDLMIDMVPNLHNIVFVSDATFYNRNIYRSLRDFLIEEFPGIKLKWLVASEQNAERLQMLIGDPPANTAVLMSSWVYSSRGPFGYPLVSSAEHELLNTARIPVFALSEAKLKYGVVGGVFADNKVCSDSITAMFTQMINGADMHKLPFIYLDESQPVVNYPAMLRCGLSLSRCPKDTIFIDKPPTFWEKYHWELIAVLVIVTTTLFLMWRRTREQHKQINMLNRHKEFVEKMPIPYSKAVICATPEGKVTNINYSIKNLAFDKLIKDNAIPENPFLLFPADFISKKTTELLDGDKDVKFNYHFDATDTHYEFILSLIDVNLEKHADHHHIKEIDIFASDITDRVKLEQRLKKMTHQLDLTLNIAQIIPWSWDTREDSIKFDAYSIFERLDHDFKSGPIENQEATLDTFSEFMPLIHEHDKPKLMKIRDGYLSQEIETATCRYRLRVTHEGKDFYQWVEMRCAANVTDPQTGRVLKVSGALWRLKDEDVPDKDKQS